MALVTGLREPASRQLSELRWHRRVKCCGDGRARLGGGNLENLENIVGGGGGGGGCRTPAPPGATRRLQCGCGAMRDAPCNATRLALLRLACDNFMVRSFCGGDARAWDAAAPATRRDLACAKRRLDLFSVVYLVERMNAAARLLGLATGWRAPNVTPVAVPRNT